MEVEGPLAQPARSDEAVERYAIEALFGEGGRGRLDDVRPGPLGSFLFRRTPDHPDIIPTGRFLSPDRGRGFGRSQRLGRCWTTRRLARVWLRRECEGGARRA